MKSNPAKQAFTQIVDTGFFKTVEWDAVVSFASDGGGSPSDPLSYLSSEMTVF